MERSTVKLLDDLVALLISFIVPEGVSFVKRRRVATVSAFLTVGFCRWEKPTVNHRTIDRGYQLIDGNQLKGGLGMYYKELKLKYKGKQAAIQELDRVAEFSRKLPEWVKESNAVIEEIRKAEEKK